MSIELLLATGNEHKAKEFSELFDKNVVSITAAPNKIEVVEDGTTFNENALKKAKAYYEEFGKPVMSDDSGLVVDALPGELGIHTARFGGDGLTSQQRNELLLKRMENVADSERSAYFVCVLCFYLNDSEVFFFEGRMKGKISHSIKGEEGFGYDPVFIAEGADAEGKTVAMIPDWKKENSHRSLACRHAQKFFKERDGQN
ncbi:MAG: non-canonical purine NTP pyrophosphatase, RdgB/HAM1 family [Halobacteriovoraceae bacterium]|nr:non-canonical purine NTP pyrophosphatase, RdgB/HAM1 family [Halobacteriovoraceae bacterium]|tara:strand:- start:1080 stop:1682 length:603 start_codon:yes stop_codon:yes gene_type:complete